MNSHFHLVLYGTEEECRQFGRQLMALILHRINRVRAMPYNINNVAISADYVGTKEDLMSIIAYVMRNPIEAGFRYDPRFYKWSSAALYFAPESFGIGRIGDMSRRTRVATLQVYYELPPEWTYSEDGTIMSKHFVAWQEVENIFGGIRAYIAFMYIKKDKIIEMNKNCLKANFDALSDDELRLVARQLAKKDEDVSIKNMDMMGRIKLAQSLRKDRGAGIKQLARVLDLDYNILNSLIS